MPFSIIAPQTKNLTNRSKTEIISQILETASGGEDDGVGATKTEKV